MAQLPAGSSPERRATTILDLPNETLTHIFELASRTLNPLMSGLDTSAMTTASLVCRQWRDPAQRQLGRHLFSFGPRGKRMVAKFIQSPAAGRYPVEHIEVIGGPGFPLEILPFCRTGVLRVLTLEGLRSFDGALLQKPEFLNLKRVCLAGVTFNAPNSDQDNNAPCNITLTSFSSDTISLAPPIQSLIESSSNTLENLNIFLAAPAQTTTLLKVFHFVAKSLRILSFSGQIPEPEFFPHLQECESLESFSIKATKAHSHLLKMAAFLPPSVTRLEFTREPEGRAVDFIVQIIQLPNLSSLQQVNFPHYRRGNLVTLMGGEKSGPRFWEECEARSIRVSCWEDFV